MTIFDEFSDPIYKAIADKGMSPSEARAFITEMISDGSSFMVERLQMELPRELEEIRKERQHFEKRLHERWREPLDHLELLWISSQELIREHAQAGPYESPPVVFDTLNTLSVKALLVSQEIMCLLRGGFPDGALARWRTLHEIVCVFLFIQKHGEKVATLYRHREHFDRLKAAKQYKRFEERAGLTALDQSAVDDAQRVTDEIEKLIGRRLRSDWDWASEALGKDRPTFADIEENVGLDHWRPRYKWSSGHIHAGRVDPAQTLALSEADEFAHIVGASNSGLGDPISMTAVSFTMIVINFIRYPNSDDLGRFIATCIIDENCDNVSAAVEAVKRSTK